MQIIFHCQIKLVQEKIRALECEAYGANSTNFAVACVRTFLILRCIVLTSYDYSNMFSLEGCSFKSNLDHWYGVLSWCITSWWCTMAGSFCGKSGVSEHRRYGPDNKCTKLISTLRQGDPTNGEADCEGAAWHCLQLHFIQTFVKIQRESRARMQPNQRFNKQRFSKMVQ